LVPPQRTNRPDTTSADAVPVLGGGSASTDRIYDLLVKVGGIERSITYLEGQSSDARTKLDSISTEIAAAKASLSTLKWILGAIGVGICGPLTAFVVMWAKHSLGW
jgi:hypothetical protein